MGPERSPLIFDVFLGRSAEQIADFTEGAQIDSMRAAANQFGSHQLDEVSFPGRQELTHLAACAPPEIDIEQVCRRFMFDSEFGRAGRDLASADWLTRFLLQFDRD